MRLLREPWPLPTMYHIISSGMDTSVSVLPYCTAAVHSPAPNLRIESRGRGLRFGSCDSCDDCDGIFDTAPAVKNNRHNRHQSSQLLLSQSDEAAIPCPLHGVFHPIFVLQLPRFHIELPGQNIGRHLLLQS